MKKTTYTRKPPGPESGSRSLRADMNAEFLLCGDAYFIVAGHVFDFTLDDCERFVQGDPLFERNNTCIPGDLHFIGLVIKFFAVISFFFWPSRRCIVIIRLKPEPRWNRAAFFNGLRIQVPSRCDVGCDQ